jgi:hypothetical protein
MSEPLKNQKQISRRSFLPILGTSFLLPFLGFGQSSPKKTLSKNDNDDYQTLLKPDGTIVKVKTSTLQKSKIVNTKISNSSFLNWLNKKL